MINKNDKEHGGKRIGAGRKKKGMEYGLKGESIKFSVNMPIEIEKWIMSKDGNNRNDKLIKILNEQMKKG